MANLAVPGITGILMIIILVLMSLSSIDLIRNSSYDLFQIFHRLSIVFVLLLFLHPSSHVLKEQSNVHRHHPEFCYSELVALNRSAAVLGGGGELAAPSSPLVADEPGTTAATLGANGRVVTDLNNDKQANSSWLKGGDTEATSYNGSSSSSSIEAGKLAERQRRPPLCLDSRPVFVAQSSICWYVLSAGLSCYLLDLVLRKWRRSKSSIQLLDVGLDREGNLIELRLSNNHRRFQHWLPGQFVYLNCPQIAAYEWHPFTISSMDNKSRRFSLHIKTGGDWTRKLREQLERRQYSMSADLSALQKLPLDREVGLAPTQLEAGCFDKSPFARCLHAHQSLEDSPGLSNLNCYDSKTGQLQIECTNWARIAPEQEASSPSGGDSVDGSASAGRVGGHCVLEIDLMRRADQSQTMTESCASRGEQKQEQEQELEQRQLYSVCKQVATAAAAANCIKSNTLDNLNLFIDGPFHSPFERLLEQQVSVCIANGVGWTAFSSAFQCITNNFSRQQTEGTSKELWWTKWRNFAVSPKCSSSASAAPAAPSSYFSSSNSTRSSTFTASTNSLQDSTFGSPKWAANVAASRHQVPSLASTLSLPSSSSSSSSASPASPASPDPATSTTAASTIKKLSDTKLHLMVIVTSIEQLKPFYHLARDYFDRIRNECQLQNLADQLNPVREITAFITRSTEHDAAVREFCLRENLSSLSESRAIKVNDVFTIQFGKPNFDTYLSAFSNTYANSEKISVYCCGSYQVKKEVREICLRLNKMTKGCLSHNWLSIVEIVRADGLRILI